MRIALDTNFLVYAEGINDVPRRDTALRILGQLPKERICLPVQVLGELFRVLTRKGGRDVKASSDAVLTWADAAVVVDSTRSAFLSAIDLATMHQLSVWDSLVLSCAAEADCRLLLSEDMQDGFVWRGLTVANPFAPKLHPLLASALNDADL